MKAALVVNQVSGDLEEDLGFMERLAHEATRGGAELILFPEAAPTGLLNNDDPEHDLALGSAIPGPITERLGSLAREAAVYLAAGIVEHEGSCLYDSAVLLDPLGEIILRYRRINPQWHGANADPKVYRQGDSVAAVSTSFGRITILICGDLFDDDIVAKASRLEADYLLFPFARNFSDGSFNQQRWDDEEETPYAARAAVVSCTTLMTNVLVDRDLTDYPSFGGAMAVSAEGKVLAKWPLGIPGVLIADV